LIIAASDAATISQDRALQQGTTLLLRLPGVAVQRAERRDNADLSRMSPDVSLSIESDWR
jgi:hypothetical protein